MNQNQHWYIDNLDAYLKGNLSKEETQYFEEILEQDPLLKSEASLQKNIYEAICEVRKNELKDRLNKLNIEPTAPFYALPKAALIGTLAVASVLTGLLVYFDYQKDKGILNKTSITKDVITLPPHIAPSQTTTDNTPPPVENNQNTVKNAPFVNLENNLLKDKHNISFAKENNKNIQNINLHKKLEPSDTEILDLRGKNLQQKIKLVKETSPIIVFTAPETHHLDKPVSSKLKNLRALKGNQKQNNHHNLAYNIKDADSDLGIFDGKNEPTLETMAEKNKLSYQYYNGKLFLFDPMVRGKEIHVTYKGKVRHFLYYEQEFFEFFDNSYQKTDLKRVLEHDVIDLLNKEIINKEIKN